ncbi:MAG: sulfurtransferase TusA family protein [Planctomycetota bacterium]|jgi:sulfite reductase (ferredoxin)
MTTADYPLLRLPQSVVADIQGWGREVERFKKGEITPIAFKAYRVPMGVYEQRKDDTYMARVRLAAGSATPAQLRRIAELSTEYGNGQLHVTTRQDIQIHDVNLENLEAIHQGLLEVGLACRGGGGNTVRNISATPRAGVDPYEAFDVRPYAIAAAEYLLQFPSSYNLPRKYKIAFSGTAHDSAFAAVADLGFFAHEQDGVNGFHVFAGGGLGNNPRIALQVEEWIPADQALHYAEAVKRVFDTHGDRSNKHAARLRYVVKRLGSAQFKNLVHEEFQAVLKEGLSGDIPEFRPFPAPYAGKTGSELDFDEGARFEHLIQREKQAGFYSVHLNLALGDISATDLIRVANLAADHGDGLIRTAQNQDLYLCAIPGSELSTVIAGLGDADADLLGKTRPAIAACAGASTCKLGLCLSRDLASAIETRFAEAGIIRTPDQPAIRISGCPNSCGNHHIAEIGFEGKARRVHGRLMPTYEVLAGGYLNEGNSHLAERLGAVPAKLIPDFLVEAHRTGAVGPDVLRELVERFAPIPDPIPEEFYVDWGQTEAFSLAGRGPGECSVGTMDIIRVDLDEAQVQRKAAHSVSGEQQTCQHLYNALLAGARSLLPIYGLEPSKDRQILDELSERLVTPGWVRAETQQLIEAALDWKVEESTALLDLEGELATLLERLQSLFASLDAGLNFRLEKLNDSAAAESQSVPSTEKVHEKDLLGVGCPMNFVKAKVALESIPVGEVLAIALDAGDPVKNVPDSFAGQGQEVLSVDPEGDHFIVKVRRTK